MIKKPKQDFFLYTEFTYPHTPSIRVVWKGELILVQIYLPMIIHRLFIYVISAVNISYFL